MEKKRHTMKNTIMSTGSKFIIFLGQTFSGRNHDYTMLKKELPPALDWFALIQVLVDLGYQGIQYSTQKASQEQKQSRPSVD